MSELGVVGDCIGQGTAGAALVSQVNLDQGLMDHFQDSQEEIHYGVIIKISKNFAIESCS